MGLFDIFKKRNNEEEKNNSKVEEVKSDETAAVDDEQKTDDKVDQVSEQATVTSEKEQESSDQEEDSKESDVDDNADEEKVEEQTVEEQTVEEQPAAEKPVEDDQTKFTEGLEKSRSTFGERLNRLFANFRSVDEDFFEDLEDTLIESDVGFDMAVNLTDQLRDEVKLQNAKSKDDVQNVIIQKMIDIYDQNGNDENTEIHFASQGPTVILFVGVNGVGKTTTIGKMANMYKQQGKKVLLAAADTFRAGAIQQLDEWAKRDGVDIVKKPEQSDPSAVVYEAVHKAKDENYDILFVDTAGRLQNKVNLMNELAKMKKVLTREIPDAPHEVLLVLDSTTGQNALNQAKLFKETTNVSGIVLTKLDGTAKGGIVLAIRNELHVPVKYVGLGEKVEDLREFNANDFVYGLFKGLIK
ncbi:Signal recognition particle receptor FtsY [Apilactobacillus kunkeei]|nr:Signal recognition particle receptor FtsY [Apilactobacillus kunkeei]CAI2671664.1 Signal recognition particle receptor FtsY [Apilactobacillus kunkeei]